MIERNAEPIAHRNPYKPIEFGAHPSAARRQLPRFISMEDYQNNRVSADMKLYRYDPDRLGWVLK